MHYFLIQQYYFIDNKYKALNILRNIYVLGDYNKH